MAASRLANYASYSKLISAVYHGVYKIYIQPNSYYIDACKFIQWHISVNILVSFAWTHLNANFNIEGMFHLPPGHLHREVKGHAQRKEENPWSWQEFSVLASREEWGFELWSSKLWKVSLIAAPPFWQILNRRVNALTVDVFVCLFGTEQDLSKVCRFKKMVES